MSIRAFLVQYIGSAFNLLDKFEREVTVIIDSNGREFKPIVWCRDCKHLLTQEPTGLLVCEREHDKSNWYMPVEPDGFCAWGERRN